MELTLVCFGKGIQIKSWCYGVGCIGGGGIPEGPVEIEALELSTSSIQVLRVRIGKFPGLCKLSPLHD